MGNGKGLRVERRVQNAVGRVRAAEVLCDEAFADLVRRAGLDSHPTSRPPRHARVSLTDGRVTEPPRDFDRRTGFRLPLRLEC
jgi:hypothetical protein